ncbi:MAG: hypothetical protein EOS34_28025 [Mesorhizobium sp.]|nr:MAG: hypothetical protein EOS34_28025 [Mesorhizobium sp.]
MIQRLRVRKFLFAVTALCGIQSEASIAAENCTPQVQFFVTGKWRLVLDTEAWASAQPTLDFGNLLLTLNGGGSAIYEYKADSRRVKSTWRVEQDKNPVTLCLPNNPFDPDQECPSLYESTAENDRTKIIGFSKECADGQRGIEAFFGVEQSQADGTETADTRQSETSPSDDPEAESGQDDDQASWSDEPQTDSQVPRCSAPEVTDTVSKLLGSTPLSGEQILALGTVGGGELSYAMKSVRTEGELLNGYACAAVVTAKTSGNPDLIGQLMLLQEDLLGDRNINYSVKLMDDGQVMVNIEPY